VLLVFLLSLTAMLEDLAPHLVLSLEAEVVVDWDLEVIVIQAIPFHVVLDIIHAAIRQLLGGVPGVSKRHHWPNKILIIYHLGSKNLGDFHTK
jgi:hypothetical protein